MTTPPSQQPTGAAWGTQAEPQEHQQPVKAAAPRRKSRKSMWIGAAASLLVLVTAATTLVILEPWKKDVSLPDRIGVLAPSSFHLPWGVEQGLIGARNTLVSDTWAYKTYMDADPHQLVYVRVAPVESPDPAARVGDFFRVLNDRSPGLSSGALPYSLSDIHAVEAFPATVAASCGEQAINERQDPVELPFGQRPHVYKRLVFCVWADTETTAIVVFLERDMASSEAYLVAIWQAVSS